MIGDYDMGEDFLDWSVDDLTAPLDVSQMDIDALGQAEDLYHSSVRESC